MPRVVHRDGGIAEVQSITHHGIHRVVDDKVQRAVRRTVSAVGRIAVDRRDLTVCCGNIAYRRRKGGRDCCRLQMGRRAQGTKVNAADDDRRRRRRCNDGAGGGSSGSEVLELEHLRDLWVEVGLTLLGSNACANIRPPHLQPSRINPFESTGWVVSTMLFEATFKDARTTQGCSDYLCKKN